MAEWHAICCLFAADIPYVTEGLTMKRRGLIAFAAAGVIIGGAWLITATAIRAQQQPAPATPPAQAATNWAGRSELADCATAERQEDTSPAGNAGNDAMGLVQQRPAASAAHQFRRYRRHGNDDAQPQSGHSRHDDRTDQEAQN